MTSAAKLAPIFSYTPKGRPLDVKEDSELLCLSADTLEGSCYRGVGPRYFMPKGTHRVWYAERDLLKWLAFGHRRSTSEQSAAA